MGRIMAARLIRWRREWKTLLIWLILPLVGTIFIMQVIKDVADDSSVPVAIVNENHSELVDEFLESLEAVDLIAVEELALEEALQKLKKHQIDSVFVFHKGYEENIMKEEFRHVITAYRSNMSFAYPVTSEIIYSYALQDASRAKAAGKVEWLYKENNQYENWDRETVIATSKERQEAANLLSSNFSYYQKELEVEADSPFIIRPWGIWALLTIIITFFMFDWVQKENESLMKVRWLYTTSSFSGYALVSFLLYSLLLFSFDLISLFVFGNIFNESISLSFMFVLLMFRITINLLACILAFCVKQKMFYYALALIISLLLSLVGGAVIPVEVIMRNFPWLEKLSPVHALLTESIAMEWLVILIILFIIFIRRAGGSIAASK